jgi:hypothetical protein
VPGNAWPPSDADRHKEDLLISVVVTLALATLPQEPAPALAIIVFLA